MIEELELAVRDEYRPMPEPELLKHVRQAQRGGTAEPAMAILLQRNIRLILRESIRMSYRASPSFTEDDIQQTALIAFCRAVHGYKPARGVRFSTFAVSTLRWELKRACDNGSGGIRIPVMSQRQLGMMRRGESELKAALGRSPTAAEVARATGFSEVQLCRLSRLPRVAFSLDDEDEAQARRLSATDLDDEREADGEPHTREVLLEFLQEVLPAPLYEITRDYFGFDPAARSGRTIEEIAERLHLEESRVTRLLWKAQRILRQPENASRLVQILGSGACRPKAFCFSPPKI